MAVGPRAVQAADIEAPSPHPPPAPQPHSEPQRLESQRPEPQRPESQQRAQQAAGAVADKPPSNEPAPAAPASVGPQPPVAIPPSILSGRPVELAGFTAETWPVIFAQLTFTGVTRSIASHCALQHVEGTRCHLLLDTRHAALFNEEHRRRIEQSLADYFGTALQVTIETGAPPSETPAARRLRLEDERKLAAVRDFTHDPAVQALVERFGAEILYDSITSLLPPQQ